MPVDYSKPIEFYKFSESTHWNESRSLNDYADLTYRFTDAEWHYCSFKFKKMLLVIKLNSDGVAVGEGMPMIRNVVEARPPREWWVNIYRASQAFHRTKDLADHGADDGRIECIRVREVLPMETNELIWVGRASKHGVTEALTNMPTTPIDLYVKAKDLT